MCRTWPLIARFVRLLIITVLALSASAEQLSRIYVYARRETPARGWLPVFCDSQVAEIRRGAFFAINVSLGHHVLGLEKGVPISVEAGSGEEAFVRLDWHHKVGRPPIPAFKNVRFELATKEMRFLSYADAKRLRSASVPPSPLRRQNLTKKAPKPSDCPSVSILPVGSHLMNVSSVDDKFERLLQRGEFCGER